MPEINEHNEQGGGVGAGGDDSVGGAGDAGIGGAGGNASGQNPSGAAGRAGCGMSAVLAIAGLGGAVTAAVQLFS